MSSWFGLREEYLASEVGITSVYDEALQRDVELSGSTVVTACFGGLPAGWSWALFSCHDILEQSMSRPQRSLRLPQSHASDRGRTPVVSATSAGPAPYVDNANILWRSDTLCNELLDAVVADLTDRGSAFHQLVQAAPLYTMLGLEFGGDSRCFRP